SQDCRVEVQFKKGLGAVPAMGIPEDSGSSEKPEWPVSSQQAFDGWQKAVWQRVLSNALQVMGVADFSDVTDTVMACDLAV
ncbi:MAG: hypothetical protein WCA63_09010, partial [Gallionella sp.]